MGDDVGRSVTVLRGALSSAPPGSVKRLLARAFPGANARAPALSALRALAPLGVDSSLQTAAIAHDLLDWLDADDVGTVPISALELLLAPPTPRALPADLDGVATRLRGIALGFGGDSKALGRVLDDKSSASAAEVSAILARKGVVDVSAAALARLAGSPDRQIISVQKLSEGADVEIACSNVRSLLCGAACALRRRERSLQCVLERAARIGGGGGARRTLSRAACEDALLQRLALPIDNSEIATLHAMADIDGDGDVDMEEILYAAGEQWDEGAEGAGDGDSQGDADAAEDLLEAAGIDVVSDDDVPADDNAGAAAGDWSDCAGSTTFYVRAAEAAATSIAASALASALSAVDGNTPLPLRDADAPGGGSLLGASAVELSMSGGGGAAVAATLSLSALAPAAAWGSTGSPRNAPLVAAGAVSVREALSGTLGAASPAWAKAVADVFRALSDVAPAASATSNAAGVPTEALPLSGTIAATRVPLALSLLGLSLASGASSGSAAPLSLLDFAHVVDAAAMIVGPGIGPLADSKLEAALARVRSVSGSQRISRVALASAIAAIPCLALSPAEALAISAHAPGVASAAALAAVRDALTTAIAASSAKRQRDGGAVGVSAAPAEGADARQRSESTASTSSQAERVAAVRARRKERRGSNASVASMGSVASESGASLSAGGATLVARAGVYPTDPARLWASLPSLDVDTSAFLRWLRSAVAQAGAAATPRLIADATAQSQPVPPAIFAALDPLARIAITRLTYNSSTLALTPAILAAARAAPATCRMSTLCPAAGGATPAACLPPRMSPANAEREAARTRLGAVRTDNATASRIVAVGAALGADASPALPVKPRAAFDAATARYRSLGGAAPRITAALALSELAAVPLPAAFSTALGANALRTLRIALVLPPRGPSSLRLLSNIVSLRALGVPRGDAHETWSVVGDGNGGADIRFVLRAPPAPAAILLVEACVSCDAVAAADILVAWSAVPLMDLAAAVPNSAKGKDSAPFILRLALRGGAPGAPETLDAAPAVAAPPQTTGRSSSAGRGWGGALVKAASLFTRSSSTGRSGGSDGGGGTPSSGGVWADEAAPHAALQVTPFTSVAATDAAVIAKLPACCLVPWNLLADFDSGKSLGQENDY